MAAWISSGPQLLLAGVVGATGVLALAEGHRAVGLVLLGLGIGGLAALLRPRPRRAPGPFPEGWRRILEEKVAYYRRLDPARRPGFERGVADFIATHRFTGVKVRVDDELKVLAAASARILLFNRPGSEYPRIAEILFYPGSFDGDFRHSRTSGAFSGMNADFGAIVFSAPELIRAFEDEDGETHVGLHEFAHALDRSMDEHNGIPAGMGDELGRRLDRIRPGEMRLAKEGRSVLDDYAATNEVEFFAVATESYFQQPAALREGHPELFEILREYYGPVPEAAPEERPRPAKRRPDPGRPPSSAP